MFRFDATRPGLSSKPNTEDPKCLDLRITRGPVNRNSFSPVHTGTGSLPAPEVLRSNLPSLKYLTVIYDPDVRWDDVLIRPFDLALSLENMGHIGRKTSPPATGANDDLVSRVWMVRDQIKQATLQLACQSAGNRYIGSYFEWLADVEACTRIKPNIQFMLRFKRWPDSGYLVFDLRTMARLSTSDWKLRFEFEGEEFCFRQKQTAALYRNAVANALSAVKHKIYKTGQPSTVLSADADPTGHTHASPSATNMAYLTPLLGCTHESKFC